MRKSFSIAGLFATKRRNRMSTQLFEVLVIIKGKSDVYVRSPFATQRRRYNRCAGAAGSLARGAVQRESSRIIRQEAKGAGC